MDLPGAFLSLLVEFFFLQVVLKVLKPWSYFRMNQTKIDTIRPNPQSCVTLQATTNHRGKTQSLQKRFANTLTLTVRLFSA